VTRLLVATGVRVHLEHRATAIDPDYRERSS
jgi:hypothetical protein